MTLTIDGIEIQAHEGEMVLSAAQKSGIFIPTLCQDDQFPPHGGCGLCIVEIGTRLRRACATPVEEGMVVSTNSHRVNDARRRLLELQLSDHAGDCKAPCQLACPGESDCQGYIALIAQGKTDEAYKTMMEAHPFPGSIGRVCPRPCEANCRRKLVDEPINIAGLKRYGADNAKAYIPEILADTGKSIAIVGGGPGGLTSAYFLKRAGHHVAVYDRMPKMGGLLRYGIPEYRLPKAVVDKEINVLAQMGIDFRNNKEFGRDISLSELQQQYDAVIIAIGAGNSLSLDIPGEDLPHVIGGIDFLRKPTAIHGDVVVIGGSNTAIDAARTALRLGAASVTVAYRRTKDEMPAEPEEIAEAEEEGINFKFLVAPLEINENIRLQKMSLEEPDASGRRSPQPIPGQEETLEADMIIVAIGQSVAFCGLNTLEKSRQAITVSKTYETNLPGVYAIGDATGQSAYAIEAIGHGRKVAAVIHDSLLQQAPPWEVLPDILSKDEKQPKDFDHIPKTPREINPKKEAPKGFQENFDEIHMNLSTEAAVCEAKRCLSCACGDYDDCKLLSYSNRYKSNPDKYAAKKTKLPLDYSNPLFTFDPNKCISCGLCVKSCKHAALTMANRGIKTTVKAPYQSSCKQSGQCMTICPVGARVAKN